MEDYSKAELLLNEALEINQKVLGSEHPVTAQSLNNLAALELDLGKLQEAKRLDKIGFRRRPENILPDPLVRLRGPATRLPASLAPLHAFRRAGGQRSFLSCSGPRT
jgi:hypothetical protein